MYRYVSFGVLIAVILLLGFVFYRVMAGFLLPLFLAALLVVIFRPVHRWTLEKIQGRQKLAALLTTLIIMLIVLLPLLLLIVFAAAESRAMVRKIDQASIGQKFTQLRSQLNLDLPAAEQFADMDDVIQSVKQPLRVQGSQREAPLSRLSQMLDETDELHRAGKRLADALQLTWPGSSQPIPPSDARAAAWAGHWLSFAAGVVEIESRLKSVDVDDDEAVRDAVYQYSSQIRSVMADYANFKRDYLGGSTWAWLKEMANPNQEELDNYLAGLIDFLRTNLLTFGGATTAYVGRTLFGIAIMVIALYFFLLDGPAMLRAFKGLSPLDDEHEDKLIQEFDSISRAVVLATLLSAIAQGLLAGIGFYVAGLQSVFLLMLLTTMLALIPFVGAAAVWVPACIYLYAFEGRVVAAIVLAVYGFSIISMADNVIKPLVLHGQSNLHPLWALLSVLGGVAALGPIGILVGPMAIAFLQALLKILQREMSVGGQRDLIPAAASYQLETVPGRAEFTSRMDDQDSFVVSRPISDSLVSSQRRFTSMRQ